MNSVCVKQQNKKGRKKSRKKKKKKEKLSISSENQRRLPHWLFPFVILIVLMTPKIPKISFSVRSAFCLCSFIILTILSDIWYVQPQLSYPKERMIYAMAAANLERDIFCVSLIYSLSPHVQDACSYAAVIGFLTFQFPMGEEDWLEVAFCSSHDLVPTLEISQ